MEERGGGREKKGGREGERERGREEEKEGKEIHVVKCYEYEKLKPSQHITIIIYFHHRRSHSKSHNKF